MSRRITGRAACTRPPVLVLRTTTVAAGLHVTRPTRHHRYVLEAALLHLSEANVQALRKPQLSFRAAAPGNTPLAGAGDIHRAHGSGNSTGLQGRRAYQGPASLPFSSSGLFSSPIQRFRQSPVIGLSLVWALSRKVQPVYCLGTLSTCRHCD